MDEKNNENRAHTQVIMQLIYEPMVAHKTGRYPLEKILNRFPSNERSKIKEGIDAVIEIGIFLMDQGDICLTNQSELFLQVLFTLQQSPDSVPENIKTNSRVVAWLAAIDSDSRLTPPN